MGRFRFFAQRDTDPGHPSDGIERQRRLRQRRELLGVYLDLPRGRLHGSRVASIGSGRWSRFEGMHSQATEIPSSLLASISSVDSRDSKEDSKSRVAGLSGSSSSRREGGFRVDDLLAIQTDFADWLSRIVGSWARQSGSSEEDLLCVVVHDSGWNFPDFDGAKRWVNPVDTSRLAELCGWPVLSGLRAADVAAGGRGDPLDPLPHWFLLADRNDRVAESHRITVRLDRDSHLLFLPASDGLDAEHPLIQRVSLQAWEEAVKSIARGLPGHPTIEKLGQLATQGRASSELRQWLESHAVASRSEPLEDLAGRLSLSTADVARTILDWIVDQVVGLMNRVSQSSAVVDTIILIGAGATEGYLKHALHRATGRAKSELTVQALHERGDWESSDWDATLTATLGFLHVDQQPASLPWLTGADVPRLHGLLAPGHLASWRRLLVEMADFRPPPMKLREAV